MSLDFERNLRLLNARQALSHPGGKPHENLLFAQYELEEPPQKPLTLPELKTLGESTAQGELLELLYEQERKSQRKTTEPQPVFGKGNNRTRNPKQGKHRA